MGNNVFVMCNLEDLFVLNLFSIAYVASTLTASRLLYYENRTYMSGYADNIAIDE